MEENKFTLNEHYNNLMYRKFKEETSNRKLKGHERERERERERRRRRRRRSSLTNGGGARWSKGGQW